MPTTMNDATLPPPCSTSTSPSDGDGNRSDSSNGEGDSDTPLIDPASSDSKIEVNDGKPDNKQKRKRTSPKDQAILEAEYTRNPKPNKAARAVVVEKVDMNEKEVQIWFQNRRQINRRKSRPLLPHEIVAFGLGGMAALSSDLTSNKNFRASQTTGESVMELDKDDISSDHGHVTLNSQDEGELPQPSQKEERAEAPKHELPKIIPENRTSLPSSTSSLLTAHLSAETLSTQTSSFSITDSVLKSFSSNPGYLSNRWNAVNNLLTPLSSQASPIITPSISHPDLPSSCPEKIGSIITFTPPKVRLSMSLDGKAQLVSELSPPREHSIRPSSSGAALPQKRASGLHRSQSAFSFGHFPRNSSITAPFIPRLTSGRSRDARTWEFCCDPEAHDELTAQAQNESNGSAVAAISLMRSTSKSALKSNSNKRNAPSTKQDSNIHGKKPKLGRAMSSLARLQGAGNPLQRPSESTKGKDRIMRSPSGDSDKENWVPGESGGNPHRRPLPTSRAEKLPNSKVILGNNCNVPTHAVDFGGPKNKRRKGTYVEPKVFEDQENEGEVVDEVEKFMRGEISPSKKGDLDCVQGLLSLSQGNWR